MFEGNGKGQTDEHLFRKTRPDDFIQELRHIESALASSPMDSGLFIERGLDTMLVVAAAYKAAREKRTVHIDYSSGYAQAALK